jgi:hypothetical protein
LPKNESLQKNTIQNNVVTMKKRPILFAILFVLATPFASQAHDDHLEPVDETHAVPVKNYYDQLLPLLHAEFSPVPAARYTVVPSFSPEYAWSLERGHDGGYFLLTHKLVKNLWYNGYKKTNTRPFAIGKNLHDAVDKLFSTVTRGIRPIKKDWRMTDGVRFYFTVAGSGGRLITGDTHSPGQGSLMWRLTRLCDALMVLPDMEEVSESDMLAEIDTLLRDIQMAEESGSIGEWQESAVQRRLRERMKRGPEAVSQEKLKELTDMSMSGDFKVRPWGFAWHRDVREPVTRGTAFFSQEEILAARDAVIADLERRDEERFLPDLFMNELTERVLVIEAWFSPRSGYAGEAGNGRTYYVRNGTIIPEAEGKELAEEFFRPLGQEAAGE